MENAWRKCSTCKKDITYNQIHYVCSISTCRTHATDYKFCSVECWDAHVPVERHRGDSASAIEKRSPRSAAEDRPEADKKRIVVEDKTTNDDEVLVVVTKVRKYILDKSGLSTSAGVYDVLTKRIRSICDRAIEEAKRQGRKTVMDRDVP